jgi:hypothetical protein
VGANLPNRVAQCVDVRHQQIRTAVEEVHREEEDSSRNPVAAIGWQKQGGMRCAFPPYLLMQLRGHGASRAEGELLHFGCRQILGFTKVEQPLA